MEKGFRLLLIAAIFVVISLGLSIYKKANNIEDANLDNKVMKTVKEPSADKVAVPPVAEKISHHEDKTTTHDHDEAPVVDFETDANQDNKKSEDDLTAKASIKPMIDNE